MKKLSTNSRSQPPRVAKLKRTPDTREGPLVEVASTKANLNASKKRSKRRKISKDTASPARENNSGLAIFPDELLLEILSYYPESEIDPNRVCIEADNDPDIHFVRRETLNALSQTCRNLRRFLHPYVWRRIEVFFGMRVSYQEQVSTQEEVALELLRQLEIVTIRDPMLVEYVKYVESPIRFPVEPWNRIFTDFWNVQRCQCPDRQLFCSGKFSENSRVALRYFQTCIRSSSIPQ